MEFSKFNVAFSGFLKFCEVFLKIDGGFPGTRGIYSKRASDCLQSIIKIQRKKNLGHFNINITVLDKDLSIV